MTDTLKRIAPEEWEQRVGVAATIIRENAQKSPGGTVAFANTFLRDIMDERAKLVAAVEERDRMLRLAGDWCEHVNWDGEGLDKEAWLADLRARAARDCEEGK